MSFVFGLKLTPVARVRLVLCVLANRHKFVFCSFRTQSECLNPLQLYSVIAISDNKIVYTRSHSHSSHSSPANVFIIPIAFMALKLVCVNFAHCRNNGKFFFDPKLFNCSTSKHTHGVVRWFRSVRVCCYID